MYNDDVNAANLFLCIFVGLYLENGRGEISFGEITSCNISLLHIFIQSLEK